MELLATETLTAVAKTDAVEYLTNLKAVLDTLSTDDICAMIALLREARDQGRQVFVIGNGGSAATASHMACDLAKTVLRGADDHRSKRFRVVALTDNVALLTAWGNDANYDKIFAEQLTSLAQSGDILIAISGSGNSPNIVEAVKVANELHMKTIGLLGFDGGAVGSLVDRSVVVKSSHYGYIEDAHMVVNHLVTAHFLKARMDQLE